MKYNEKIFPDYGIDLSDGFDPYKYYIKHHKIINLLRRIPFTRNIYRMIRFGAEYNQMYSDLYIQKIILYWAQYFLEDDPGIKYNAIQKIMINYNYLCEGLDINFDEFEGNMDFEYMKSEIDQKDLTLHISEVVYDYPNDSNIEKRNREVIKKIKEKMEKDYFFSDKYLEDLHTTIKIMDTTDDC